MRLALSLLAALLLAPAPRAQEADFFAIRKNFGLFGDLYELLASEYVDAIDAERLMRTGIAAMTGALDPYTVFLDEGTAAAGRLRQQGGAGGVGAVVEVRDGRPVVTAVLEATSAETQGVRPGDALVSVAGRPAEVLSADAVERLLVGDPGTTVEMVVEREGETAPLRFDLVRAEADAAVVSYSGRLGDDVGYVRLDKFFGDASAEVGTAVTTLQQDGALRGLVLDLRGNPGGLLQEAVEISGLFLPAGTLVTATRGRAENTSRPYRTAEKPQFPDLPVAVLVDGVSASASEIVAGALQDHDRGVVVGETTFGKGLVQVVRPTLYGTALKLTVSRYTTPSGREIQRLDYRQGQRAAAVPDSLRRTFQTAAGRPVRSGGGIEPDVPVARGGESELERALVRTAAFLRFANRYAARNRDLPAAFRADDALLRDFQRFVEGEGLEYRTEAERRAEALAEALAEAGYDADGTLQNLRRDIEREKSRDFERHAGRLRDRLRTEILGRYTDARSVAEAALRDDAVVQAAHALLTDPRRYAQTLGG